MKLLGASSSRLIVPVVLGRGDRLRVWDRSAPRPWQVMVVSALAVIDLSILAVVYPKEVIGLLVVGIGLSLVIWYPSLALFSLLLLEPYWGASYAYLHDARHVPFGPLTLGKDAIIGALVARAVLHEFWRTRRVHLPRSGFERFVLAYILYYAVLTVATPQIKPGLYAVARVIEGPLLMLGILHLRPSRRTLTRCGIAIVGAASVIAAAGLIEHFGPHAGFQTWYGAPRPPANSSFYGSQGKYYRVGSFLGSPLTLAFYLAAAGPFALGVVGTVKSRWKPVAFAAAAICFGGLVVTVTRSGYIGGAAGALVTVALVVRNPARRAATIGLLTLGIVAIVFGLTASGNQAFVRTRENSSHSGALRLDVERVLARPLGYGLGTTDFVAQRFQQAGAGGHSTESELLAKAIEGGVGGLLAYLVLVGLVVRQLRKARRRCVVNGDWVGVSLAAGALGSVVALMGASLFLGVEELVVEVVVWGAAGLALAYAETGAPLHREATKSSVFGSAASAESRRHRLIDTDGELSGMAPRAVRRPFESDLS